MVRDRARVRVTVTVTVTIRPQLNPWCDSSNQLGLGLGLGLVLGLGLGLGLGSSSESAFTKPSTPTGEVPQHLRSHLISLATPFQKILYATRG